VVLILSFGRSLLTSRKPPPSFICTDKSTARLTTGLRYGAGLITKGVTMPEYLRYCRLKSVGVPFSRSKVNAMVSEKTFPAPVPYGSQRA
jgi:hypothetical protein